MDNSEKKDRSAFQIWRTKVKAWALSVFQPSFLQWVGHTLVFVIAYTLFYFLFTRTFRFTAPYLLAVLFAWALQPLMRLFTQKLKLKRGLVATILLVLLVLILIALLGLLIWRLVVECIALFEWASKINVQDVITFCQEKAEAFRLWLEGFGIHLNVFGNNDQIDWQYFWTQIKPQMQSVLNSGLTSTSAIVSGLTSFVGSMPTVVLAVVLFFFALYYFTRDMFLPKKDKKENRVFRRSIVQMSGQFYSEGLSLFGRYISAYMKLISISGVLTFIAFIILGVPYPLLLGLLAAFLDLFPIIGISLIYIPAAIVYAIQGNWFVAIALIVALAIITVVRQVAEPKLVSQSINVHPLIPLGSFFLSMQLGNLGVFIFLMGFVLLYVLFQTCGFIKSPTPLKKSSTEDDVLDEPEENPGDETKNVSESEKEKEHPAS